MEQAHSKKHVLLIYLALALFTIVAFEHVRLCEFTATDDAKFVTTNSHVKAGLTGESLVYAFTATATANWMPLTWLSVMLDAQIFGHSSATFHLMNLFYHVLTVLLLFLVLKKMTGALWRSAFVAAVFAVHPLRVESVAWIAERKDVLSGLFWMLTTIAYVRYAQRPGIKRYLPVLLALFLGLLAKPMLVTLPCVLLLLDCWPLGRLRWGGQNTGQQLQHCESAELIYKKTSPGRLIAEKIPLFILVAASCVVTFIVQRAEGAVKSLDRLPLGIRINNALVSYVSYLGKMIWPTNLAVLYPHPVKSLPMYKAVIALLILVSLSAMIIYAVRRRRDLAPLLVGWLWYLGTMVPVIGLVQVGSQRMADRYTYIPSIGILIMVAWGAAKLSQGWRRRNLMFSVLTGLLLVILTLCTRAQVKHWENSLSLFGHTAKVTRNNAAAHHYYGNSLFKAGRITEAALHLERSLKINPRGSRPYTGLAKVYLKLGKFDEAIALCTKRLRIGEPDASTYNHLAKAYVGKKAYGLAAESLIEALRIKPGLALTHKNLVTVLTRQGNADKAIGYLTEAIRLNPGVAQTHLAMARALKSKGRIEEAVIHFRKTVQLQPKLVEAANSLAWILATHSDPNLRSPAEAVSLALQACEIADYQDPGFVDTLAAAYAAAGRFSDAVVMAEKAVSLIASGDNKQRIQAIRQRMQLYKQQKPYLQPPSGIKSPK
ncbi:MAG: tetratricopeptide repeat protein [Planctomycetota bacterium]|jgi:tetratricopeptide (TPR) repeat protein